MLTTGGIGLGAIHASGAFDVAQASRRFNLGVSDDHEALLKIEENPDISGEAGESVELATITNEFSEELSSLEITTADGGPVTLDSSDQPTELAPGEDATLVGELSCTTSVDEEATLQITADGPDNRVELTRGPEVHCEPADETCVDEHSGGVKFNSVTDCDVSIESGTNVDIKIQSDAKISGNVSIEADNNVDIKIQSDAKISGNVSIEAGNNPDIKIQSDAEISGNVSIEAGNNPDIKIQSDAKISGDVSIEAGNNPDIKIHPDAEISGVITIDGEPKST